MEQWNFFVNLLNKKSSSNFDKLSGKLSENWILDSGYSHHMSVRKNFLENLQSFPPYNVKLPNGSQARGVQMCLTSLNPNLKIHNVLHIPQLRCNLIALSELSKENNCVVIISDNVLIL